MNSRSQSQSKGILDGNDRHKKKSSSIHASRDGMSQKSESNITETATDHRSIDDNYFPPFSKTNRDKNYSFWSVRLKFFCFLRVLSKKYDTIVWHRQRKRREDSLPILQHLEPQPFIHTFLTDNMPL